MVVSRDTLSKVQKKGRVTNEIEDRYAVYAVCVLFGHSGEVDIQRQVGACCGTERCG